MPDAEPEVLDADSVSAKPQRKAKASKPRQPEPSLHELADHLGQCSGLSPVRDAILHLYGGDWTPDRELAVLRLIKADDRFVIVERDRVHLVGLIGSDEHAAEAEKAETERLEETEAIPMADDTPAAEPAKTLGEHVETAQSAGGRVSWPVDIGYRVLLLTEGLPDRKARIRNIANHGAYTLYDLVHDDGGTIDGVPANRIGRDLEAEDQVEQGRMEIASLRRHIERGATLAQKIVEMQATERRMAEALSEHRKKIAEAETELAEHARTDPGQTDLRDVVGGDTGPSRGEKMASEPTDDEDLLADHPVVDEAIGGIASLTSLGVTTEAMEAAAYNRATASTGKPQKVRPVAINARDYVVTDVEDGVATLLPIVDRKAWDATYAEDFGEPRSKESDAPSIQQTPGGELCGVPVKHGRTTKYIAPERDALLVRLPPAPAKQLGDEAETAPVGKEAAAGG